MVYSLWIIQDSFKHNYLFLTKHSTLSWAAWIFYFKTITRIKTWPWGDVKGCCSLCLLKTIFISFSFFVFKSKKNSLRNRLRNMIKKRETKIFKNQNYGKPKIFPYRYYLFFSHLSQTFPHIFFPFFFFSISYFNIIYIFI